MDALTLWRNCMLANVGIHWLANQHLATETHFSQALTLWCVFALRVIKCGLCDLYHLLAIRQYKVDEEEVKCCHSR